MKRLITTTALALVMAGPALAQTAGDQQEGIQAGQQDGQPGTGAHAGVMHHSDLLASELMDAQIFAPSQRQPQGLEDRPSLQDQQALQDQPGEQGLQDQPGQWASRWGEPMGADQLEGMENIGNVNDLLLDEQGNIQAILVDVGGFLGMGARQVAIGLDQVSFVTDPDDTTQIYIVTTMGADMLESTPEFDATAQQDRGMQHQEGMQQDAGQQQAAQQQDDWLGGRDGLMAPDIQREGYEQAEANEISADELINANLYDVNDDNVGNVSDVVLGPEGEAQYIVADVGGFLGLGAHTVAIGFDELSVMRADGMTTNLRIYVDVTEDTLRSMPEYEGT